MKGNLMEWIEQKYSREELLDALELYTTGDLIVALEDYIEAMGMDKDFESQMVFS